MPERAGRLGFQALLLLLWAGAAYHMVFGGMYSVFDVGSLEAQRDSATMRIDGLIARTDSLVHRGDSLASVPAAIERVAREKYGPASRRPRRLTTEEALSTIARPVSGATFGRVAQLVRAGDS